MCIGIGLRLTSTIICGYLLLCSGCAAVGPDFQQPDVSAFHRVQWAYAQEIVTSVATEQNWWGSFNDPELNRLISTALRNNLSIAMAQQRLQESLAYRGVSKSELTPDISLGGYGGRVASEDNVAGLIGAPPGVQKSLFAGAALAGWELDLWGRVRRLVEAADYTVLAAEEALGYTSISISAQVALAYVELRGAQSYLKIQSEIVNVLKKQLVLSEHLLRTGLGSKQEVLTIQIRLEQAIELASTYSSAASLAENRLATLVGMPPKIGFVKDGCQLSVVEMPNLDMPASILSRRPDIQQAEYEYAAANAQIGVAAAERYPKISLGGVLSFQADAIDTLFRADRLAYLFGTGVTVPIFTGGRIDSAIQVRESQAGQKLTALKEAVLKAVREVEDCTINLRKLKKQNRLIDEQLRLAAEQKHLEEDLYERGLAPLNIVLSSQRDLLEIKQKKNEVIQMRLIQSVTLYKALGGSWGQKRLQKNVINKSGEEK